MRTSKEGTCGGGRKSYYVRAKVQAEGLNETLAKRLAKKYIEIFGYASSWIQASVLLDSLFQISIKKGENSCRDQLSCRDTVAETLANV